MDGGHEGDGGHEWMVDMRGMVDMHPLVVEVFRSGVMKPSMYFQPCPKPQLFQLFVVTSA